MESSFLESRFLFKKAQGLFSRGEVLFYMQGAARKSGMSCRRRKKQHPFSPGT